MPPSAIQVLPRTSPEQQGIASSALLRFVEALDSRVRELHSFMVLRHGSVVAEGWWHPYRHDDPHAMFSVSKSFTSIAVGFAVSEERFAEDDPVLSFFPEDRPADVSGFLESMTVRHLLTMSTGHAVDSWAVLLDRPDGNWIKAFFEVPVVHAPGTHFLYDTGASYMLSAIVQRTTGMTLVEYLEPRLFAPLGIEGASWETSPQGISMGGIGLSLRTEDLARFGQFVLQKGMWEDRRLLPESWIDAATSPQISNGNPDDPSDSTQGYGYQFWRCRHNAYRASGLFGQYCNVLPDHEAVVVFTSGIDIFDGDQLLDLVWDRLLPAMEPDPRPADEPALAALSEKLSTLSLPLASGEAESPVAPQALARTYRLDENPLGIATLALDASPTGWVVRVTTRAGEESFSCGYGVWERGETTLFNNPHWFADVTSRIAASGAWTANDTFTLIVRLYETPVFRTLVFIIVEDEVLLEVRVNVTLESPEPLLLTGR
ncbi:MAG: beta-lactamase family protein [Chloroflexi bacterium]|nr:beta-lactamase family protein [Chloroflexota bacterium]